MPEILEAIILGIVQGLTEFLPVSSSGHLEIFKFLLGDKSLGEESMLTTVFLHFATAIATLYVFRKDIYLLVQSAFNKEDAGARQFAIFIILSMIPAVIAGLFFESFIESFFNQNLILVGVALVITAFLLWSSENIQRPKAPLSNGKSILIGIAQAVAILPGISRSGATIATSLLLGIEKEQAARFSFLMVVPLIFGKISKDLMDGDFTHASPGWLYLSVGFASAFLAGVWACTKMIKLVRESRLYWFAIYCLLIGLAAIITGIFAQ